MKGPILCLAGPPGTGKTSLGQSIAKSMGREFVRVAMGGVRDEAEIRGHRRTYVGSMPGRIPGESRRPGPIIPSLFSMKLISWYMTSEVILPVRSEVLDPEQNHTFSDHYIDVSFDLSKCFFIATANDSGPIPQRYATDSRSLRSRVIRRRRNLKSRGVTCCLKSTE